MKIVLDLKVDRDLRDNDIIVFKDNAWRVISKESFFARHNEAQAREVLMLQKNDKKLALEIEKLQKDLVELAKIVKEK